MKKELRLAGQIKWVKPLIGKPGSFRLGLGFFNSFWELDTLARQGKLQVGTVETLPDDIQ
jgi:hypothetical protein